MESMILEQFPKNFIFKLHKKYAVILSGRPYFIFKKSWKGGVWHIEKLKKDREFGYMLDYLKLQSNGEVATMHYDFIDEDEKNKWVDEHRQQLIDRYESVYKDSIYKRTVQNLIT